MRLTPKNYRKENEWLLRRMDVFLQKYEEKALGDLTMEEAEALIFDSDDDFKSK